jgi:hypothetical protein
MKTKNLLFIALPTVLFMACGGKKEGGESSSSSSASFTKEQFQGKGRTCWTSTAGPRMFGEKICFNDNGTANMGEGFGPFKVENGTLTLTDNNKAVMSETKSFPIVNVTETSFTITSNNQDMVFTKE